MAAPTPAFVSHCVELLQPLGTVRTKRMFGGWGLYVDEIFIAIVAFERLYLKVNDTTRAAFEAEGCEPFVYDSKTGSVALGYWTAPADALDSPALMQPWARRALQAALAARAAKPAAPARKLKTGATPR
jgi:DNA transformation protein and related proteins